MEDWEADDIEELPPDEQRNETLQEISQSLSSIAKSLESLVDLLKGDGPEISRGPIHDLLEKLANRRD